MDLKETELQDMEWKCVAQDTDQVRAVGNTVINFEMIHSFCYINNKTSHPSENYTSKVWFPNLKYIVVVFEERVDDSNITVILGNKLPLFQKSRGTSSFSHAVFICSEWLSE